MVCNVMSQSARELFQAFQRLGFINELSVRDVVVKIKQLVAWIIFISEMLSALTTKFTVLKFKRGPHVCK